MKRHTDNFQISVPWGTAFKAAIFGLHLFLFIKLCYRWMIKRPIMMEAEIEYESHDGWTLGQNGQETVHPQKEDKKWIS